MGAEKLIYLWTNKATKTNQLMRAARLHEGQSKVQRQWGCVDVGHLKSLYGLQLTEPSEQLWVTKNQNVLKMNY